MTCQHKNRIETVQRKGDSLIAKVTCQDCGEDVDLFAAWALERAEKAEARVEDLLIHGSEMLLENNRMKRILADREICHRCGVKIKKHQVYPCEHGSKKEVDE